ncbi:TPA: anaerobic sulfatase maturase [Klebsiella pneumoniae]|uniref:anaerobic sulfatase maturase n=1 Tax=Klebsiella pneumoniae TaxID=573 RepID=UPI0006281F9E|nr:anaerobic sulfatase maturase [Klebsiella pneumoniae]AWL53586.1 anaerobic sulfatase maturase [Klebsiella pneumoniae subsp. pneumoniae]EKJ7129529.1 anaerobic sulfatase maturase [Klebsiella pneumoniae]ELN4138703.1 anaerobic sulfatase maturase [Klebsiella pneumoniae]KKJ30578.1 radical SAM protein [Klebsiella pneumoniae MRSN 3562]MBC4792652.1 anaerobic sulfatase maturase [Klebsiella pneumoniae]
MLNIAALRQQQIPLAAEPRSPVPFHILMKPIGPACNLACRYCYYPQDETPVNKMDDARLEQFIRRYIAAQPAGAREINFVWQGGEPLLAGLSFYKKALALQARYAPDGVTISNSLQTNGTLINDAWCRLFREHGFIIGLSLEGNEALQDYHRPDKRGRSTWSAALRGIDLLHQHQVDFNLLVVVHNEMAAHAAAIYDRLVSLGARYLQFQPLMSEGAALREGYQLSADNWGRFMVGIWRQWRKRCDRGRVFVINIEQAWAQYFTHTSGSNLVMEPDGQLYACDHLINAEHRLGRLDEQTLAAAVDASVQLPFGQQKSLRRECQTCSVKMVCQGGCPAHLNAAGNNRLCGGYYRFFSDILAPLRPFSRDLNGLKAWRAAFVGTAHTA